MTIKPPYFPKEVLKQLAADDEPEGYEVIEKELTDSTRWSLIYTMVFKYKDQFYMTYYSCGATEIQYEEPYQDEDDFVLCVEVEPKEVTKIVYIPFK